MKVKFQEYNPSPAIVPFIASYWEGTFCGQRDAPLHQKVVPHGYLDFIIHLSNDHCDLTFSENWEKSAAFTLTGLWTQPYNVRFNGTVKTFGIRFTPEAFHTLFRIPAAEFINRQLNIESDLGKDFLNLCDILREISSTENRVQFADSFFLKQLYKRKINRDYVQLAAATIRKASQTISVEDLSNDVAISSRQLEREFKNKFGLSPKRYMRIIRISKLQQDLSRYPERSFSQLSYDFGYADQAHFIRDFKVLTGESPSRYLARMNQFIHL